MNDFVSRYEGAEITTKEVTNAPETTVVAATTETEKPIETTEAVVTTEVVEETKPEVTTEGSLFDKFTKPTTEAAVVDGKPTVEIPNEVIAELDAAKQELEKYKSSPLAKLLGGDYDLTKVDIKDFLKQAVGEDYSHLSDDALVEKSLQANPNWDKLTPEEQTEEIELEKSKLEGMSRLNKLEYREGLLNKLNQGKDANDIFKTLEEIKTKQGETIADPEEWYKEKSTNDFQARYTQVKDVVSNNAKQLIGQEYLGYKVTEDDAKVMEQVFDDEVTSFNEDTKSFNLFKIATYEKAVAAAYERGKLEAIKADANPSMNHTNGVQSLKDNAEFGGSNRAKAFLEAK